jgi:hypothetical protein
MCNCGAMVRERALEEVVGGSNPAMKKFFHLKFNYFIFSFYEPSNLRNLSVSF